MLESDSDRSGHEGQSLCVLSYIELCNTILKPCIVQAVVGHQPIHKSPKGIQDKSM
jgi:hypothetical protein